MQSRLHAWSRMVKSHRGQCTGAGNGSVQLHVLLVGAALRQGEVLSATNSPKGKKPVPAFPVAVPKKGSVLQAKLLGFPL